MDTDERPSKMRKLSADKVQNISNAAEVESQSTPPTAAVVEMDTAEDVESTTRSGKNYGSNVPADSGTGGGQVKDATSASEDSVPPPDETAPLITSTEVVSGGPGVSKNQMKKIRRKLEWEAKRDERKVIRKEKGNAKKERKRALRDEERVANGEDLSQPPAPPARKPPSEMPVQLPITFMIDCDFDDLMRDNERISLASQITRSYSDNKNSKFRAHLTICSFGGHLKERFDTILTHYKSWKGVRFLDGDFVTAAAEAKTWMEEPKENKLAGTFSSLAALPEEDKAKLKDQGEIVYLSSESNNTLAELKPYSTYIIGGLVDKNREKGICYKRAVKAGVKTARLPIGEFMDMQSRKVLATNHVNEIMVRWLEGGDWGKAFLEVIPKRKGGKLKESGDGAEGGVEVEDGAAAEGGADEDGVEEVPSASGGAREEVQSKSTDAQVESTEGQNGADGDAGADAETQS